MAFPRDTAELTGGWGRGSWPGPGAGGRGWGPGLGAGGRGPGGPGPGTGDREIPCNYNNSAHVTVSTPPIMCSF